MAYMINNKTRTIIAKYMAEAANWHLSMELEPSQEFQMELKARGCCDETLIFSAAAIHRVLTEENHTALVVWYGEDEAKALHPDENETIDESVRIDTCDKHRSKWLAHLYFACQCYRHACTYYSHQAEESIFKKHMLFHKGFASWIDLMAHELAYMVVASVRGEKMPCLPIPYNAKGTKRSWDVLSYYPTRSSRMKSSRRE